jgi:hypothetical protein
MRWRPGIGPLRRWLLLLLRWRLLRWRLLPPLLPLS